MLRAIVSSYRGAFTGLPRQVWVLAACLFVNRLGMMVLPFLELYLTGELGFEVHSAGRLVALYGVGSILGIAAGGWCTDRFGPRRVQLASLCLTSFFLLVLWRARTPWALAMTVVALSFSSDAFRPANGAAIASAADADRHARSFSLMSLAINLGLSLGLPLGGLLAEIDFALLFWIDAGTTLCAALVLFVLSERGPAVPVARPSEEPQGSPWRDRRFLYVIALMALSATVLFQFFGALPVFLEHDLGFDKRGIGLALGLNTVVTAAFGMLVVRWAERKAVLSWMAVGAFLICAGYGVNALGTHTALALVSIVVWSVGEMLFFPLGAAFATGRAPAGSAGRYLSVYHLGFGVAFVLAPLVGTQLYATLGPRGLWACCALVGVVVWGLFGLLRRSSGPRNAVP